MTEHMLHRPQALGKKTERKKEMVNEGLLGNPSPTLNVSCLIWK